MSNITAKKPRRDSEEPAAGETSPVEPGALEPNTLIIENESLRRGFTVTPNYILRDPLISIAAKLTYILLLSYAWQEGSCFPGQARLARDLNVTRQAINKYLRELKDRGFITWNRRGMGKTNIYVIQDYKPSAKSDVNKRLHQDVNKSTHQDVNGRLHKEDTVVNKDTERKQQQQAQPPADDVIVVLLDKGISHKIAQSLATRYPKAFILEKIDLLEYLQETDSALIRKNPAGYLRKAIEEDYKPPQGFKTRAQRDAERKRHEEEAAQLRERDRREELERKTKREQWRARVIADHQISDQQLALWDEIMSEVREQLGPEALKHWLDLSILVAQNDGTAVVAIPFQYASSQLAESAGDEIAQALSNKLQEPMEVRFQVVQFDEQP